MFKRFSKSNKVIAFLYIGLIIYNLGNYLLNQTQPQNIDIFLLIIFGITVLGADILSIKNILEKNKE